MTPRKRIYNEHGAHSREVMDDLQRLGVDAKVKALYMLLIDAGYESRDTESYITEVLSADACEHRLRAGLEFRRAQREAEQLSRTEASA